jgi:hypothetical protein
MKKIVLTIAIVLGMTLTSFGQYYSKNQGGLFGRSSMYQQDVLRNGEIYPFLPQEYGMHGDQNAVQTPVGSGIALLLGLGAAYAIAKKRKEE